MYRPLGRRVLVRPDPPERATESGLVIPDSAQDRLAMSGIVVAVGPECAGPSYHIKAAVLHVVEQAIEAVTSEGAATPWKAAAIAEIRALLCRYYDQAADGVTVGMGVAFPATAGTVTPIMEVSVESDALILLDERDIVAAWDPAATTVEAA